jgi:hypothetical protein
MNRNTALTFIALAALISAVILWRAWSIWSTSSRGSQVAGNRPPAYQQPIFSDVADRAGVRFTYFRGETGKYWITETTGGGVALADVDGDGWLDIVVTDGCHQPPDGTDKEHTSHVFRNNQDGTFLEITNESGASHSGYGQGCYVWDYDNDGFDDLYLTYWGPNVLLHNRGDGTYELHSSRMESDTAWSTGAVPGDFDRDGDLDLLVVRYLAFDYHNLPRCGDPRTGVASYCGPDSFDAAPSVLLRNDGAGSFEDESVSSGIVLPDGSARPQAKGLGAVAADLNDDGWLDIYVANDMEPNFLFLNETAEAGSIRFGESGVARAVATSVDGAAQSSMGVACGDYDSDGRLDLLVTNYYLEGVTLYKNLGADGFVDTTRSAGLLTSTRRVLGWGTGFFDFDNDGDLDLFMTNGHVQSDPGVGVPYAMGAQLFLNQSGVFQEISETAGDYFRAKWNGRGAAFGDIDNDGDSDVVVVHHHQPMAILRNDLVNPNRAVQLNLLGRLSDRAALGARVTEVVPTESAAARDGAKMQVDGQGDTVGTATDRRLMRHVASAGSYLSGNDRRVYVGVGPNVDRVTVEVIWPSGRAQVWRNVPISHERQLVIREPY